MPLRASNYELDELKHVVIIGDKEYIRKEWKSLRNFPKINILNVRLHPDPVSATAIMYSAIMAAVDARYI